MPEGMNPSQEELEAQRAINNAPQRAAEAARLQALQAAEAEGKLVMPPRVEGYGGGTFQPEAPEAPATPEQDQQEAA